MQLKKEQFLRELPAGFIEDLPDKCGIYAVGGSIRDSLLPDIAPRELDLLVTKIPLKKLLIALRRFGTANLVGRSFAVIKWYPDSFDPIDVSLPAQRDISLPDGCEIDPELPIEEDLGQRDFTVNAIAMDLKNGDLLDPFSGIRNLSDGKLVAITENSLSADPIRCLRAAYICARCRLQPDNKTLDYIKSSARKLPEMATERIAEELKKLLLELPQPSDALRFWRDWGLLKIILPELAEGVGVVQEGGWHAFDVFEHNLHTVDAAPPELEIRLAALLHDVGKPRRKRLVPEKDKATFYGHQNLGERMAKKVLTRLKFPNDLTDRVARLVRFHMFNRCETDKGVRRFIRNVGADLLDSLFALRFADIVAQGTDRDESSDREYFAEIQSILENKPPLTTEDLAVTGYDIMNILEIESGPGVGEVLNYLMDRVIDNPDLNDREILIDLIEKFQNRNKI